MYIVSSCLLGMNCKYNGENNYSEKVVKFLEDKSFVMACPEQMGGLSTPRDKCEISRKNVITENGEDVTLAFEKGVRETLKIVETFKCTHAILQERSPSCGVNLIYDGSFSDVKIKGMGVTASALKKRGLILLTKEDI